MFNKFMYSMFCKGKKNIRFRISPDHVCEAIEIGDIRDVEFISGNIYKCKLVRIEHSRDRDLFDGIYEVTNENQILTFEQFCKLV